jgi:hypothetical protein
MDTKGEPGSNLDLTCWYLNIRRLIELVGAEELGARLSVIDRLPSSDHLTKLAGLSAVKDALLLWLEQVKPPTLGQLVLSGQLQVGQIFTSYGTWYFKNSSDVRGDSSVADMALAYTKLDNIEPGLKVQCRYDRNHLTSSSSRVELAGQKPMLVMALITEVRGKIYEAIPYVIASPLPRYGERLTKITRRWGTRLEVFIDGIDSFEKARSVRAPKGHDALTPLKQIPEEDVKKAFAEIIGEQVVPKDWGGERSDLFTSRLMLDGDRVATAIAFKGPAKFRPLTMAGLGKNGDQINRLFSEPADLFIVQHCHEITPQVREVMRAFAQQVGRLRLFCLIDGYDTIRILKAYGKCGFKYSPRKRR